MPYVFKQLYFDLYTIYSHLQKNCVFNIKGSKH